MSNKGYLTKKEINKVILNITFFDNFELAVPMHTEI